MRRQFEVGIGSSDGQFAPGEGAVAERAE